MDRWLFLVIPIVVVFFAVLAMVTVAHHHHRSLRQWWQLMKNDTTEVVDALVPEKTITQTDDFSQLPYESDAVRASLDSAAHSMALRTWCEKNGYEWLNKRKLCTLTPQQCAQTSNENFDPKKTYPKGTPLSEQQAPFLRVIGGACMNASMTKSMDDFCTQQIGRFTSGAPAGSLYMAPDTTCDPPGSCNWTVGGQTASCILEHSYCERMGLDYSGGRNATVSYVDQGQWVERTEPIGDCTENDAQAIAEMVLSKTLVRTMKRSLHDMVNSCRTHGVASPDCLESAAVFELTDAKVVVDSVIAGYKQDVSNWKDKCEGGYTGSEAHAAWDCALASMDFFPPLWITHQVVNLAAHLFKLIPWDKVKGGLEKVGLKVGQMVLRFGLPFVSFLHQVGPEAIHDVVNVIDKLGPQVFHSLSNVVNGVSDDLRHAYANTLPFARDAAQGIASLGNDIGKAAGDIVNGISKEAGDLGHAIGHLFRLRFRLSGEAHRDIPPEQETLVNNFCTFNNTIHAVGLVLGSVHVIGGVEASSTLATYWHNYTITKEVGAMGFLTSGDVVRYFESNLPGGAQAIYAKIRERSDALTTQTQTALASLPVGTEKDITTVFSNQVIGLQATIHGWEIL